MSQRLDDMNSMYWGQVTGLVIALRQRVMLLEPPGKKPVGSNISDDFLDDWISKAQGLTDALKDIRCVRQASR